VAERRGLLQGRRLSVVQDFGIQLLVRQERLDQRVAKENAIRNAMVAAHHDIEKVYPELFSVEKSQQAKPDGQDEETGAGDPASGPDLYNPAVKYDYTGFEYEDPANYEKDMATLDALMKADHMVITQNPEWSE
jgi:hypothetical protein